MNNLSDHPELLDRQRLQQRQFERLTTLLYDIRGTNPFWTRKLGGIGKELASLDDLASLPLCTKAELIDDQAANSPYGSNLTYPSAAYSRLHQTSGTTGQPLRWLDTPASWSWLLDCWEQMLRIAGLRSDDRLAFPFSFGPFLGFWAAFDGANRLGNLCLAGGGMSSEARLRLIEENSATVICCTPTYALRLAETAAAAGIDLNKGSVRALIVAGEPGGAIAATRERIESAWGARVFDHWGMTEIGALAMECVENPGGMHVLETECIAEIIDPTTSEPVAPGTVGELVITNLGRAGSPLIRYRTGDLVRADTKPCPCGRELLRLDGGVLGRADEMITVRGNNVYPSSLEAVLRSFADVAEYRIEVDTRRSMQHLTIQIEPIAERSGTAEAEELVRSVSRKIKNRLNFTAEVKAVAVGALPRFELKGRRFVRRD